MKRFTASLAVGLMLMTIALPSMPLFNSSPAYAEAKAGELDIPSQLAIQVVFAQPVTSKQIKAGDNIPVTINQDVEVEDTLVFKRGAQGVVFVDSSKTGRSFGRGGSIEITSGKLTDVYGNEHYVKISEHAQGVDKSTGKILPAVSLVVAWPLALFGFKKGEEAMIPAGKMVYAYTTVPSTINTKK